MHTDPVPWATIAAQISTSTGHRFDPARRISVGGGCINAAFRVEDRDRAFFVKLNAPDRAEMFDAEAAGLGEIAQSRTVRVPHPICHGVSADASWIVLEHIALSRGSSAGMRRLGHDLAAMHRVGTSEFGWHRDNAIGSTPQVNNPASDWVAFWREHRLGFQLQLAAANGYRGALQRSGDKLLSRLDAFFHGHTPQPALLHGDLWSGNAGFDVAGQPVVFDPAVYYGDREADLAMTELFGGFSNEFYAAYREAYPLDAGYAVRKDLYNLYHVLNHLNLFGGGYLAQAERLMEKLLAMA